MLTQLTGLAVSCSQKSQVSARFKEDPDRGHAIELKLNFRLGTFCFRQACPLTVHFTRTPVFLVDVCCMRPFLDTIAISTSCGSADIFLCFVYVCLIKYFASPLVLVLYIHVYR